MIQTDTRFGADEGRTDNALLTRLRTGCERACGELVRRHAGELLALALTFLEREPEAHAALQEAFTRAFRGAGECPGEGELRRWLHRLLIEACLTRLAVHASDGERAIQAFLPRFDERGLHREPVRKLGAGLASAELRGEVRRCISHLPAGHRVALLLCDVEGLATGEAARLVGLAPAQLSRQLHQARQALLTLLQPAGERAAS